MAIRLKDINSSVGRLNVPLADALAAMLGSFVAAPGRSGLIVSQLQDAAANFQGLFQPSSNVVGQIVAQLNPLQAAILASFFPAGGQIFDGLTPTIYAAFTARGTGSGSSEANAAPLANVLQASGAQPGDVVGSIPDIYAHSTGASPYRSNTPAWMPANSGTLANPIRIVAKHAAARMANPLTDPLRSELRAGSGSYDGPDSHPVFGSADRNHIHWIGFACDEALCRTKADNGPYYVNGTNITGATVRLCAIKGASAVSWFDNHSAIRIGEGGGGITDPVVGDCRLWNFNNTQGGSNVAAIITYGARNLLIEHCEIFDCFTGYYIKGSGGGGSNFNWGKVRFNYIHDLLSAAMRCQDNDAVQILEVFQNIVDVALGTAFGISATTVGATTRNQFVHHNTVYVRQAGGSGLWTRTAQNTLRYQDNLVVSAVPGGVYHNAGEFNGVFQDNDFEGYFGSTGNRWSYNGNDYNTLAAWRAAIGDAANSQEFGSQPLVNPGIDFHLAVGHAARTAASDGGAIGAYRTGTEQIGIRAAA